MAYEFICPKDESKHKYQLVSKGMLWTSRYDVYLDLNNVGKLEFCALYKGRPVAGTYKSSAEANQIAGILKKIGITKSCLQKAKFPKGTSSKVEQEWEHILTWLLASGNI